MSRPVHVRHVVDGAATAPGAVAVLGRYFVPNAEGVNGVNGYQSGTINRKLREESDFTITFPNAAGGDGVRHLDRFLILALRNAAGDYKMGDEWIEVYEGDAPGGDLIACGTPIDATITKTSIELRCQDAYKTLVHARETAGGVHWCAAPRDVIEHYTQGWQAWLADDFPQDGRFTLSGTPQTTADGRWSYTNVKHGLAAGTTVVLGGQPGSGKLESVTTTNVGPSSPEPFTHHRVEVTFTAVGLAGTEGISLDLGGLAMSMDVTGRVIVWSPSGFVGGTTGLDPAARHTMAMEMRGRWIHYYVDGALISVQPLILAGGTNVTAKFQYSGGTPTTNGTVIVESFIARRTRPFLLRGADKGDYRLPGAPTPGGLLGSYFSDVSIAQIGSYWDQLLGPLAKPYARRVDATVNFPAPGALPNTWQPPGTPNGERFSARWTGAIYLDDPSTWLLRVTAADRARVWVGKTRFGEQVIDDWTAGGHAGMTTTTAAAALTALGTTAGWYPIVVEYSEESGVGGCILEAQKSGGAWVVPGSTTAGAPQLSPLGIFEDHVRGESHYQMIKQLCDTFGYQYTCEPQQLESGEFPGRVAPRVRCGRDYDVDVTEDDDTGLQAQISAEDCVDVLMADGQGIADPTGNTQLTAEVISYAGVGQHLMVHAEAEQQADISSEQLLLQRLSSLLALRSSPLEQVSSVVELAGGERVLVPLPLTGALAEIAWQPGDGVRRRYPSLGVEDGSQVQMTAVSRKFVPDALGLPAVTFRPRPRSFRDFLFRMWRGITSPQRNYQGQTGPLLGTIGANSAVAPDAYSRLALPVNLDDVVSAELVVLTKSNATGWDLEVNGTVRINAVTAAGPYDIKPWLVRAAASEPLMHARLVSAGGGSTGTWQVQLRLVVRV